MKQVLMIATGGTIASKSTPAGLVPQLGPEDIIELLPGIFERCDVSVVRLYDLDSTDMRPENWLGIARCIEDNYDHYDAFVITHGTDTMAYTAAALSYIVAGSAKPIVLTGSQKSISTADTDARRNLSDAFCYAIDDDSHGVAIVFDGKVITGTRARKVRTKSFNAFASVDYPLLGVIREGRLYRYFKEPMPREHPLFSRALNQNIFLLKLFPGLDSSVFEMLEPKFDALIVESFGVGGLPCYEGRDFLDGAMAWRDKGKIIVMTTQVSYEGSDLGVYEVGRRISGIPGVIDARNMTIEAAITKLMWVLGQTRDRDRLMRLFMTPVAHDILEVSSGTNV